MSDSVTILKGDNASGVLQIINAGLCTVYLVLSVVFAAINGHKLPVVMSAVIWGMFIIYCVISSITSFCSNLKAINVMLRIERGFYSASVGLLLSLPIFIVLPAVSAWTITGVLWAAAAAGIIYGGVTGRGAEKYYRLFIIFSLLLSGFFTVKSASLLGYIFTLSFLFMFFSSVISAKATVKWKRAGSLSLDTAAYAVYFTGFMVFVFI